MTDSSSSDVNYTVGQVLAKLRQDYKPDNNELATALQTSYTTYLKTERDQRELSFLMALRLCHFYGLDIHELISMIGEQELSRKDFSVLRAQEKRDRKRAEALQAKVIDIKTDKVAPLTGR